SYRSDMGGGTRLTKEIIGARCLLPKPRLVDSRVGLDFVSSEEQGDLTLGALGRIRAVDDVAPDREREIPSDGPGLRLRGIRLAHHPTDGGHRAVFFAFFAFGAGASAASSSGCSRFRPFTWAHCPSSHALKTRRPSWESFQAANSALSTWVTGFAPCFFFAQPRIEVRKVSLPTNPEKNLSSSPLARSGPSRLSIKSPRSAGMSFPFGVSIVTVVRPGSTATGASSATI